MLCRKIRALSKGEAMNPFRAKRCKEHPPAPANENSILQAISTLTGKVSAMSQQITDFVAKVEQLIAKDAATKAQLVDAQNQIAALQAQIAAGALSPDDQSAIAAEQAKIDVALSA